MPDDRSVAGSVLHLAGVTADATRNAAGRAARRGGAAVASVADGPRARAVVSALGLVQPESGSVRHDAPDNEALLGGFNNDGKYEMFDKPTGSDRQNAVFWVTMAALYLIVFLAILGARNINPAAQNTTITYGFWAAYYLNPLGTLNVDDGNNGTSPLHLVLAPTTQMTSYLLTGAFITPVMYVLISIVNCLAIRGGLCYPLRWVSSFNYRVKFVPCLLEAVCLTMYELITDAYEGDRNLTSVFYIPVINVLLSFTVNRMAWEFDRYLNQDADRAKSVAAFVKLVQKEGGAREAGDYFRVFQSTLNKHIPKEDWDFITPVVVNVIAVALKLTPMQMRFNAMPVVPNWLYALHVTIWLWNLTFTGIASTFILAIAYVAKKRSLDSDDAAPVAGSKTEAMIAWRMFMWALFALGHAVVLFVYIAVCFGMVVMSLVSTKTPPNPFVVSY